MLHAVNLHHAKREHCTSNRLPKFHSSTQKAMKYKAKCTYCHILISNLYDMSEKVTSYDGKNWEIEVETQREANIIETLENLTRETQRYYTMLANEVMIEPNL